MLTLQKHNVVDFLKKSRLHEYFFEDEICVPNKYYVNTLSFKDANQFKFLLDALRYWQIDELPYIIYENIKSMKKDNDMKDFLILLDNYKDFPFHNDIRICMTYGEYWNYDKIFNKNKELLLKEIGQFNCISLLNYELECYRDGFIDEEIIKNENTYVYGCWSSASQYGNLEILKILIGKFGTSCIFHDEEYNSSNRDDDSEAHRFDCNTSSVYGHYDNMIYLEKNGIKWRDNSEHFYYPGLEDILLNSCDLRCFTHAFKKKICPYSESESGDYSESTLGKIVKKVYLTSDKLEGTIYFECLKKLIENHYLSKNIIPKYGRFYDYPEEFEMAIAYEGNIEIFDYLCEKYNYEALLLCGSRHVLLECAAENNQLEFIKYVYEKSDEKIKLFDREKSFDFNICQTAAEHGNLEILKWAYENGCPCYLDTIYWAAHSGNIPCLKYAMKMYHNEWFKDKLFQIKTGDYTSKPNIKYGDYEKTCNYEKDFRDIYCGAIQEGHIEAVKLLNQKYIGFEISGDAYKSAVKHNQFEIFKYLHTFVKKDKEYGNFGSFYVKNYLKEKDNPRKLNLCNIAEENENLEFFKWLFDHGYTWNGLKKGEKISKNRQECITYSLENLDVS